MHGPRETLSTHRVLIATRALSPSWVMGRVLRDEREHPVVAPSAMGLRERVPATLRRTADSIGARDDGSRVMTDSGFSGWHARHAFRAVEVSRRHRRVALRSRSSLLRFLPISWRRA